MNAFYGNMHVIFHDTRWTLGRVLFLYTTLPLMLAYIIIGLFFNLPEEVVIVISVPVYANIAIAAILALSIMFPVAIGLGSTRIQFMGSLYVVGVGAVAAVILLLNICQLAMILIYQQWIGPYSIWNPAISLGLEYNFILYFWVDFMIGLFLFSFSALLYCCWRRLGTALSLLLLTMAAITILFLLYNGLMVNVWEWLKIIFTGSRAIGGVSLFGMLSIPFLTGTYFLMRNAPVAPFSH